MDWTQFAKFLSDTLPALRKRIQLAGLAIGLAVFLIVQIVNPGDSQGALLAGAIGVLIIIFGQLFEYLNRFPLKDRPKVFLLAFLMFCVLIIALTAMLIFTVGSPTMTVDQYQPSRKIEDEVERASKQSLLGDTPNPILATLLPNSLLTPDDLWKVDLPGEETINLPEEMQAGDYIYTSGKEADGTILLHATFPYIANSRSDQYPLAYLGSTFWGHPWVAIGVTNPTAAPLYINSLRIEIEEINLINEVILDALVDGDYGPSSSLTINNLGWGKASNAQVTILAVRDGDGGPGVIVGRQSTTLAEIDEGATIDIGNLVPPSAEWGHFPTNEFCPANRLLTLAVQVSYTDEMGRPLQETFRTRIVQCDGGAMGGNIPPSAYFNIDLPVEIDQYPLTVATSFCVAPNSADRVALRFTTSRSAHFRLRLTLTDSSGATLSRFAEIDIPVPRIHPYRGYNTGQFYEDETRVGCT